MTAGERAPIRRARLPELIIERIVQMIVGGELGPDRPFPTERELAQQLGVSVVALREATRVLKTLGVLGSVPGRGTVVLPGHTYAQFQQLGILVTLSPQTVVDAVETRAIIEGRAVRLAAMRATDGEVAELRHLLDRQRACVDDVTRFPREDEAFHRAVVGAAHNPILVTVLDGLRHPLREVRQQTALIPGRLEKAVGFHARLTEAIANHDPDLAESVLLEHLEDVVADVRARTDGGGRA